MVGFGAGGVDLAAHLLDDEAEFFAGEGLGVKDFHEVFAVLAEADFLFVDVVFFQVEDHLLLEAFGVGFGGEVGQGFGEFFADEGDAFAFQGLHLVIEGEDGGDARTHIGIKGAAFLGAEGAKLVQGALQGRFHGGPGSIVNDVGGLLRAAAHVREAEHGVEEDGGGDAVLHVRRGGLLQLPQVLQHSVGVEALRGTGFRLKGEEKVDGAADQAVRQALADGKLLFLGKEGTFDVDIGTLSVEGADFEGERAAGNAGLGFPVACHGLNHGNSQFWVQR